MAPSAQAYKRAHSLLLFEKLLNLRDSASPLTLILDSLEQSAETLTNEFMRRAKLERAKIVFVSFATIKKPALADVFIRARRQPLKVLAAEIASHVITPRTANPKSGTAPTLQKSLIIIDTLNLPPDRLPPAFLPTFFSSVIASPTVSLVAVYHTDVPSLLLPHGNGHGDQYLPNTFALLSHLATAVLRVSGLTHAVAARRARERSLPEPEWGLREGREGALIGLIRGGGAGGGEPLGSRGDEGGDGDGVVVEMELRRRSGRAVAERFVLSSSSSSFSRGDAAAGKMAVMLMGDHPAFSRAPRGGEEEQEGAAEGEMEATFNLGLTEKQRRDREGVVLPYFDAQVEIGGGEGGRILYDMGREDDFDEEEDEI
ncbi:Elongator complex protein 5 [Corynascus novoguineensis]|uniref:Elongator complex protein 5 n=1 Tax=Corynascus novoguineensis TaxID=1126955 RepID=A0AAN7CXW5_9PEZI|nr:Elongator complex protein 5 [Corynascus novoguineensis]